MKYCCPLLVVKNIEESKKFYLDVLGLHVIMDLGANVTLTGGIALQTLDSWKKFISKLSYEICFKSNNAEIVFEEENFSEFIKKLEKLDVLLVHPVIEHKWGQKVIRFYDPDGHIIEVGECMKTVCKRFLTSGLSISETAARMGVSENYVKQLSK